MKEILRKGGSYLLLIILSIAIIASKKNLFVDEVFAYGLANHVIVDESAGIGMAPEEGKVYEPSENAYLEYVAVQEGEQFNFINVWRNQSQDVHPPLHYLLLHIICSFFPGKFSIWYAGAINIVFAILTLWCVRRIVEEVTQSEAAVLAVSLLYVTSAGILNNISFLRMYVMAMFFVAWITYLIVKVVGSGVSKKSLGIIMVASIFGALTHYYIIVYLFFISLIFGIYLLIEKKYLQAGIFSLSLGISGGISVLIFPSMLQHMFLGGFRGEESKSNLLNGSFADYTIRLKSFYGLVNKQLFGGLFTYFALTLFFLLIIVFISASKYPTNLGGGKTAFCKSVIAKWMLLILPSICFFLIVSKMAVYQVDRYMFPIYAVALTWVVCLLYVIGKQLQQQWCQYVAMCILLAFTVVNSWSQCSWEYLYKSSVSLLDAAKQYSNVNCVYVYDASYRVQPSFYEVSEYKSVTFWNVNNMESMQNMECLMDTKLVVCIINSCDQSAVLSRVLQLCPLLDSYQKIGGYSATTSYYLYGSDIEATSYHIYDYSHEWEIGCVNPTGNNRENVCLIENGSGILGVFHEKDQYWNLWVGNKVLDVRDGIFEIGNNVHTFDNNGTDAQKWKLQSNEDGTVTFISADGNLVLSHDINGNVCLNQYNEADISQKWWME